MDLNNQRAKALYKYIKLRNNQDKCMGFIDGYNHALKDIKAPDMLEALKYSLRMLKNNKVEADYHYIEHIIQEATTI